MNILIYLLDQLNDFFYQHFVKIVDKNNQFIEVLEQLEQNEHETPYQIILIKRTPLQSNKRSQ